ncbi:MAG TPA: HPF/RaiA family ribosome-associated protein [Phycisphaerales bacterium]|nr:HPF/RaiA family ribosome-associated protein [Phycisphaerales bacterium]
MVITVQCADVQVTPSIREWAERRVAFALGQFAGHVRCVRIRVADQNGPRGGADQRCVMVAPVARLGPVSAEVTDADLYRAISRAADRLGRRVRALLDRERTARRYGLSDSTKRLGR